MTLMAKVKQKTVTPIVNKEELLQRVKKIDIRVVMALAMIVMAFVIGRLSQKVEDIQVLGANVTNTPTTPSTQAAQPAATTVTLDQIKGLWNKDLIKLGDVNKKLLFVEVLDPSCPYCHAAGGLDSELNKQMGSQFILTKDGGTYVAPMSQIESLVKSGQSSLAIVYYPGHGKGEMGMKALYCANEQGKFWAVHDLLMNNAGYNLMNNQVQNDKAQSGVVADFLKSAIDPTFLKSCIDSGKYDSRLSADQAIATSLGVQGTPGFFVNATSYPGAYSLNDMKAVADAALK